MINKEVFWKMLPYYMKIAGLNQTELGQAIGVSKSTVSCWMHRKSFPEMDTVQKIADVVGCRTDDLLVEQPESSRTSLEDIELQKLWGGSSSQAKRTALAVLREFAKEGKDER